MRKGLIILDRDGVLNKMVVDPDHGTIDSPLHPSQVEVFPWVPEALKQLEDSGFGLVIATNQPSAAKGKTTLQNLKQVHEQVLCEIQSRGARILSSHICFHRAEDCCECRKPKPGLLREALSEHPGCSAATSWMVGDGITDIQAGVSLKLKTAFLGPQKCDACKIFQEMSLRPSFWGDSLLSFAKFLKGDSSNDRAETN